LAVALLGPPLFFSRNQKIKDMTKQNCYESLNSLQTTLQAAIGEVDYCFRCLNRIKGQEHQTQPYTILFQLTKPLSQGMIMCEEYYQHASMSLLIANAEHAKLLNDWVSVGPTITQILNMLPSSVEISLSEDNNFAKPCKYKNTDFYDETIDGIAQMFYLKRTKLGQFISNTYMSITQKLQAINDLSSRSQPADKWRDVLVLGKKDYAKSRVGKASMKNFQRDVLADIKKEDVKAEKRTLYIGFKDNPIVRLHKKLSSDPEEFIYQLREGNYTSKHLEEFYDFANKLDALLYIQDPQSLEAKHTVPPVNQDHLNARIINSGYKAWQLVQLIGTLYAKTKDECPTKVDPSKRNQHFILYYLLHEFEWLDPHCTVGEFVGQISSWFPNIIPDDTKVQTQISKSIYTEKENWTDDDGLMPRYCDLQNYVAKVINQPDPPLKARKASQFRLKMQTCYVAMNTLRKEWRQ